MSCSSDAPALDLAYKLANYDNRPTLKLSTGKETLPNPKQVWRQYNGQGQIEADIVGLREEEHPGRPLLCKVMENGRRIAPRESWREARQVFESDLLTLPSSCLALDAICRWPLRLTPALSSLHKQVRRDALAG
jgi:nicotinate phosphoribosyltransferase